MKRRFRADCWVARGVQFALCMSLWQALFGERPSPGDSISTLLEVIHDGRLRQPPAGRKVPRKIVAALARGLAADPNRRWPSVSELAQLMLDHEADAIATLTTAKTTRLPCA